ncbi:MAG: hypothetical protein ACQESR_16090 [Planctomycetota bacterium]
MGGEGRCPEVDGRGFDFTGHVRAVCEDMVIRLPQLAHIDMSRVAISLSRARKVGADGVHASLMPLRFQGGARAGKRGGRYYTTQVVLNRDGQEMLYILTFFLPRFMDVEFREKLVTIAHELWHIGPAFDGDLRRHAGRCYVHTGSRKNYDREMKHLVNAWLSDGPPASLYHFLQYHFAQLQWIHGRVHGVRYSQPKLIPISPVQAHYMNRQVDRSV